MMNIKHIAQLFCCLLLWNMGLAQKASIKITVEGCAGSNPVLLNDLHFVNNFSQNNQTVTLQPVVHEIATNSFLLDYSNMNEGVYELSVSSSDYSSINFIRFIVNEKSKNFNRAESVLYVEKNKSMGNSNGFIVSGGDVHQENFPFLMIQEKRKEWDCFIKEKLEKALLDSLIKNNETITFNIAWNNAGKVINLFFENSPSRAVKEAFEKILYSSPAWVKPAIDELSLDCYQLIFDASKIDDCN